MPEEEDLVELKFRLYDGSDIGPIRYAPSSTVAMLKERIISDWPKGYRSLLLPIVTPLLLNCTSRSLFTCFSIVVELIVKSFCGVAVRNERSWLVLSS